MYLKAFCYGIAFLLVLSIVGCTNQAAEPQATVESVILPPSTLPPATATATATVTAASMPTTTPPPASPEPEEPAPEPSPIPTATEVALANRLIVCMAEPPVPLHPYTTVSMGQTIMSALNDGPADYSNFAYRPTILTADPGSITLAETVVQEGDNVYNAQTGQAEAYQGDETAVMQMQVRFTVLPHVRWSDGAPLTAADSLYAYQLLAAARQENDNDLSGVAQLLAQTANYQLLDAQTVEWTGIPGLVTADFLKFFFPPLPQHRNVTLDTAVPEIGWGAFQLVEWTPGSHLLAARNPHYFRASEGLPLVDEVEFRFFEPPYDGLLARITSANCHIVGQSLVYTLSMAEWQVGLAGTDWRLATAPALNGWQLVFNLGGNSVTGEPAVRQAIATCINRPALAEQAGGVLADSYLHPLDLAAARLDLPAYDPQVGTALLAEMGTLPALTLAAREARNNAALEALAADLAACGFNVQTETLPAQEFFAPWPDGAVSSGQYDLVLFPLNAADGSVCRWFHTAQIPAAENPQGFNISGWSNTTFDTFCDQAQASLNGEERTELEAEAQQIFAGELPALPLFWFPQYSVSSCGVAGYQLDPSATELWNIEEISLTGPCEP